jgi:phenylalanyl-tRNA synthetase beta chain
MRAPLSWLREYVTVDAKVEEIADRLFTSSVQVDAVIDVGVPDVDGNVGRFLVGRVLEVEAHPNADRLRVCQVDVGEGDSRQIVCGAWNFEAGATVAVALPGAFLPIFAEPLDERELRGQASRGMILAENEVGLGDDHAGIMVLPEGPDPGTPLVDLLPIRDQVLDVTPTVNRVDLLSMVGLAREVAALFGGELHPPEPPDPEVVDAEEVDITIEDFHGCPRYIGRAFRDVAIRPSPQWLRSRLFLAEMRSISNVVDVTNYAMHVWGSPLHAFDRAKLAGGRIVVRRARSGEELRTLDGTLRRLDPDDLLITDGEKAVALAAIMGGEDSEVTDDTTDVLLEAANFEPLGILRTSERLALRTAGSNRWEKGVDPHLAENAAVLASRLLVDLAGARLTGRVDVHDGLPEPPVVRFRPERASKLIGIDVPPEDQRSTLTGFGFEVSDDWQVQVPTWRARDVTREVDLIE